MAVKSKQIVKDAKGNPIPGLYKIEYTGGTTSYRRNYQSNYKRKYQSYGSNEKAKAIKDQLAFLKSKPESDVSKVRKYLDDLLKEPGPVFVNQNSLAKKLGVKQSLIVLH